MKRFVLATLFLIFTISLYAKDIQELVVTTNPPMSCQNCENKIKGNLRFEKGIKKIETNIPDQKVIVEYDADKTTPEKIEAAFQKIGYKVEIVSESVDTCKNPNECNKTLGNCCEKKPTSPQKCSE